jgi:hypothetical protein
MKSRLGHLAVSSMKVIPTVNFNSFSAPVDSRANTAAESRTDVCNLRRSARPCENRPVASSASFDNAPCCAEGQ